MSDHAILQTLHGYDRGHRLLQGATLGPSADDQLWRLSDLSGYEPLDFRGKWTEYFQGFPLGEWYAFQRTHPDEKMERAGCVLTHTLLIPIEVMRRSVDPWTDFGRYFDGSRGADYRAKLPVPELVEQAEVFWQHLPEAHATAVLGCRVEREPVVWVGDDWRTEITRSWWQLRGGRGAARLAFCTMAMQPRRIGGRMFDWMASPTAAESGFYDLVGKVPWYDERHGWRRAR